MKDSPKTLFIIFILFTILSLLIFWPIFLGKVNLNGHLLVSFYQIYGQNLPYKPTGWDQLRLYYPFYRVTLESLCLFRSSAFGGFSNSRILPFKCFWIFPFADRILAFAAYHPDDFGLFLYLSIS